MFFKVVSVCAIVALTFIASIKSEDVSVVDDEPSTPRGIQINTRSDGEGEMFQATNEWQVVQPGQVLPPGLHVEHNLQTGVTRAKLNNPDEGASQIDSQAALVATPTETSDGDGQTQQEPEKKTSGSGRKEGPTIRFAEDDEQWKRLLHEQRAKDNLERAFREWHLEQERNAEADAESETNEDAASEKEAFPFRTIDQIKEELNATGDVEIRTDAELLTKLVSEYPNATVEQRIAIMRDFELLLHSLDNAIVFTDLGGVELIFSELAVRNESSEQSDSEAELVEHSLHALGAALHSNEYVKQAAARSSACDVLVALLSAELTRAQSRSVTAGDQFESVRLNRLLFAISGLLRNNDAELVRFFELGGYSLLTRVFNGALTSGSTRLIKKITALLKDLLLEAEIEKGASVLTYLDVLVDLGWCSLPIRAIGRLLGDGEPKFSDNDTVEKLLELLRVMLRSAECGQQLAHDTRGVSVLRRLEGNYRQLTAVATDDDTRSYLNSLTKTISSLLSSVSQHVRRPTADEL